MTDLYRFRADGRESGQNQSEILAGVAGERRGRGSAIVSGARLFTCLDSHPGRKNPGWEAKDSRTLPMTRVYSSRRSMAVWPVLPGSDRRRDLACMSDPTYTDAGGSEGQAARLALRRGQDRLRSARQRGSRPDNCSGSCNRARRSRCHTRGRCRRLARAAMSCGSSTAELLGESSLALIRMRS